VRHFSRGLQVTPAAAGVPSGGALAVRGIGMEFSGLHALRDVSLQVRGGEILGLIGPNGSGKTTLINIITGVLRPSTGRVLLGDRDITGLASHRIGRAGIARTFQLVRLFHDLTVLENVEVAAVASGESRRRARARALVLLEELGVPELAPRLAGALPYGHERLVEIARALAARPRFLVLDEPAAGMNEEESARLLALLSALPQARDLGMIVVDHDMHLIMRLCHRLHVLASGVTIGAGTPQAVRALPAVIEAYLGAPDAAA
jgi:branched-chain amino acid transport system ATP-binding protein